MTFVQFLAWLAAPDGGALLIVMWAVSWGIEPLPQWQKLPSKLRALIILVAAIVLGILATVLQFYPTFVQQIEPFFRTIYNIVVVWLGSQVVHKINTRVWVPRE